MADAKVTQIVTEISSASNNVTCGSKARKPKIRYIDVVKQKTENYQINKEAFLKTIQ